MADYYPLIARAVANLPQNTDAARRALYEQAQSALVTQLRSQTPSLNETEIARERQLLEEAIRRVETGGHRRAKPSNPVLPQTNPIQFENRITPASLNRVAPPQRAADREASIEPSFKRPSYWSKTTMPGWVIFFLVAQGLGTIINIFALVNLWTNLPSGGVQNIPTQALSVVVILFALIAGYVCMLYPAIRLHRSFPVMAISLCIVSAVGNLLVLMSAAALPAYITTRNGSIIASNAAPTIMQSAAAIFWAIVWIAYFIKSDRIKHSYGDTIGKLIRYLQT
jgi:hypothetical protein